MGNITAQMNKLHQHYQGQKELGLIDYVSRKEALTAKRKKYGP
jgi:hypothetical protein